MQFEGLPAETQRLLLTLDTHIRAQLRAADLFDPAPVIDDALRVQKTAKELQHAVASVDTGLARDESLIDAVKRDVHRSFRAAEKGARSYEAYKQPSQTNVQSYANVTQDYFLELAAQMESRADQYQQEVEKIERHVTLTVREPTTSPQALSDVIRHQHAGLMSQAARVARLHEEVVRSRARYKDWRRRNYGDERDPFVKRQRRTHGLAEHRLDDKEAEAGKSELRTIAESTLQPTAPQLQAQPQQAGMGASTMGTKGFGGFGMGTASNAATAGGGGFGTTANKSLFGGFGTSTAGTATSTAAPAATGFGAGGFGGGVATSAPTFGFGATAPSTTTMTAKPAFGFGGASTFGATGAAAPATSTATSGGFGGFGAAAAPAANNWATSAAGNPTSSAGNAFAPPPVSTWPAGTGWGSGAQDSSKRLFSGN
ncbi:hypothetical protein SYNPS1DRAFT_26548 [Syncephalis pseudoplumigaleata]|uniref:Nucleoporin p58/p45 n=1 Tax=Syncephalis pseudoplumigaleata TaxID=1712513 RepID=A0A4P9Z5H3_9FUNG|nr:hypothetical protein SYNPS1DRAFT_26548 [Syncephalis pseudoplumigaleata]|eukprot:RKP27816.1 hypothetical protein SYNPS1DRAFT_26548 [Syncephalis pseudoplumigaleata]